MTIKEKALEFWGEKTKKEQYVVSSAEMGGQRQREFLAKEKFIHPVTKGYWLLKRPEDQIEEVWPLLYWEIVDSILSRFENWSIRGKSALMLHNGDQAAIKHLLVRTKEKTNRKLRLPRQFDISLMHDADFDRRLVKKIDVAGRKLPVDIPEKILINVSKLEPSRETKSFIAGTAFDARTLEAIYAKSPKPIVFKKLVGLAKNAGRLDLATILEQIIDRHTHYKVGRREIIEAPVAGQKPVILTPAWVIRQEEQFNEFEEILSKHLKLQVGRLKKYPLDHLDQQAREDKKYDTYHSTTLEGYRISPEEVDALLSGAIPKKAKGRGGEYLEKIKNRTAILGYSAAFDFILGKIQADFSQPMATEGLVKDTYYRLFKPSADAGITDYLSLTNYRDAPAFIRGTSHVPPAYAKLPELVASYEASVSKIKTPVIKAILAHYFFVTVHPYVDGNGRTARLLMNYLLLTSGYPWITIRVDQRVEYFEALKKGQLERDILPFGKFVVQMLTKSKS